MRDVFFSIIKLEESGILEQIKRRQWPIDTCKIELKENRTSSNPIVLRNIRAGFFILSVGIAAAVITLTIEMLGAYCKSVVIISVKH